MNTTGGKNGKAVKGSKLSQKLDPSRIRRKRVVISTGYVRLLKEAVAETRELVSGQVFADFTTDGRLIGVEVIQ